MSTISERNIVGNHLQSKCNDLMLAKKILSEKDVIHFKTKSPAYKNLSTYVDLLCQRIYGTGNKVFNHKYTLQNEKFQLCSQFIDQLQLLCEETNLDRAKGAPTLRFGHVAFRDWHDGMCQLSRKFINETLAPDHGENFREELVTYLVESFGNRMRIDYGTGHELNFIIFTMGFVNLNQASNENSTAKVLNPELLKKFVESHGWDVIALFCQKYLRLCRKVQTKFRLEPAGSRGVYNMDDYQFLPFLLGAAQLSGTKFISTSEFYVHDQVDMFKDDFIFIEAVDYILNNKRGPFNEHSYTLWCFTNLGSWDIIYRRIKLKFIEDILGPFPIIQHFLFGRYILRWNDGDSI